MESEAHLDRQQRAFRHRTTSSVWKHRRGRKMAFPWHRPSPPPSPRTEHNSLHLTPHLSATITTTGLRRERERERGWGQLFKPNTNPTLQRHRSVTAMLCSASQLGQGYLGKFCLLNQVMHCRPLPTWFDDCISLMPCSIFCFCHYDPSRQPSISQIARFFFLIFFHSTFFSQKMHSTS